MASAAMPKVEVWLPQHPRFKLHFIPTSSSWLNLVEWFCAESTDKRIPARRAQERGRAGSRDPRPRPTQRRSKPFVWTKSAAAILKKEAREKAKLDAIANGHQAF